MDYTQLEEYAGFDALDNIYPEDIPYKVNLWKYLLNV